MFHDPDAFKRPDAFARLRRRMLAPVTAHPPVAPVAPADLIARIEASLDRDTGR